MLAVAGAGCGEGGQAPSEPGGKPLRVGMEIAYEPFEFVGEDEKPKGFDVDLVAAFAASIGRPVEYVNLAFDALIPELQSSRIDVICSGMSYTDERAKTVDFSRPYAGSPMWMLANTKRVPDAAPALDTFDRPEVEIAVQRGTTGETKARARFRHATFLVFEDQAGAGNTLATGRAHLFVYDKMSIEKLHAQHPDTTRVLPGELGQEEYCMAVAKGSPLKAQIDAFLEKETRSGGKVDELLAKWVPAWEQYRVGGK